MDALIEMAEQELTRVVQITKNMLSLYRESKKVTSIKLPEIVDSVAVLLQRPLRDKSVSLSKQFLTEAQISAFSGGDASGGVESHYECDRRG
jgi:hypothetical protein